MWLGRRNEVCSEVRSTRPTYLIDCVKSSVIIKAWNTVFAQFLKILKCENAPVLVDFSTFFKYHQLQKDNVVPFMKQICDNKSQCA